MAAGDPLAREGGRRFQNPLDSGSAFICFPFFL